MDIIDKIWCKMNIWFWITLLICLSECYLSQWTHYSNINPHHVDVLLRSRHPTRSPMKSNLFLWSTEFHLVLSSPLRCWFNPPSTWPQWFWAITLNPLILFVAHHESITINFYNSIWWTPSSTPFSVETRCPCCGFDTKVLFILWSHQSGYRIRVQVLPFKITLASFLPYILTCETINTDLSLCQFLSFPGSTRRSIINSIFDRTFWH